MHDFRPVRDIIAPNLKVLFVGVNPGIYTAKTGHHFAHPSNRFWTTLYRAGFTPRLLSPSENRKLLNYGLGITNVIERATRGERELTSEEFEEGGRILVQKIKKYKPVWVAFVGIGLYRNTFKKKSVVVGEAENIGDSKVWVLPQPSGLNAHYPPKKLTEEYSRLKLLVDTLK